MTEINEKTRTFLSRFFKNTELGDQEDIFALGFVNSLFAMQLVMFLEQEFGITVETEDLDLDNFRTLEKIESFITKKQALTA